MLPLAQITSAVEDLPDTLELLHSGGQLLPDAFLLLRQDHLDEDLVLHEVHLRADIGGFKPHVLHQGHELLEQVVTTLSCNRQGEVAILFNNGIELPQEYEADDDQGRGDQSWII